MNITLTRKAARKCAALTIAAVSVLAAGCPEDVPGQQEAAVLRPPDAIAPSGKPTNLSFATAVSFDGMVTPDFFLGSGNDNASFTLGQSQGIELALRGKLRFDSACQPQNTFNSDGNGS